MREVLARAFFDELQKIAALLSDQDAQDYMAWVDANKGDAQRKALHVNAALKAGIPHAYYQASMRNLGGEVVPPEAVLSQMEEQSFRRPLAAHADRVDALNRQPRYRDTVADIAGKLRPPAWVEPINDLPPAPKLLRAKGLPEKFHGAQIPLNMIVERVPQGRLSPITTLLSKYNYSAPGGLLENLRKKVIR